LWLALYAESLYTLTRNRCNSRHKVVGRAGFQESGKAPYEVYSEPNLADYNPNPLQSFNDFSKVCRPDIQLAVVI